MRRSLLIALVGIPICACVLSTPVHAKATKDKPAREALREPDTGFLNRRVNVHGTSYKYMVYVPEGYDPARKWPVILFLHGMGERGSDGEAETNIGLPAAIRNHPERWPFVVVMPQVPYSHHYWPDADMMAMAVGALDASEREFHGDTDHTYLCGISLGGFGSWEIAKAYPGRWAAIVPVAGGIRWDWAPNGRLGDPHLADGYVAAVGKTPVWIFHGSEDHTVSPAQSEEMYDALKAAGGHVRFWEYERVGHASWDRTFAEPELPRWLLAHALHDVPTETPYAERRLVPIHPVPAKVDANIYESYVGEYSAYGSVRFWVTHEGDRMELHQSSSLNVLLPENATTYFYESGGPTRFIFQRDASGKVTSLIYRDDRHEEVFQKTR
jgi:poly(3-hydroxybutyrate) depolymerase